MKSKFLLPLLLFAALVGNAQTYTLSPGPVVSGTLVVGGVLELPIYMQNRGNDSILLKYELISNTCDPSWTVTVIDNQSSYASVIPSGTMMPVAPQEDGFLRLDFYPFQTTGSATVKYKIWDDAFPLEIDTLTYLIDVITGVSPTIVQANVAIYPNPATDILHIQTGMTMYPGAVMQLYGFDGKLVATSAMPTHGNLNFPISGFAKGLYLLRIADKARVMHTRVHIQ